MRPWNAFSVASRSPRYCTVSMATRVSGWGRHGIVPYPTFIAVKFHMDMAECFQWRFTLRKWIKVCKALTQWGHNGLGYLVALLLNGLYALALLLLLTLPHRCGPGTIAFMYLKGVWALPGSVLSASQLTIYCMRYSGKRFADKVHQQSCLQRCTTSARTRVTHP